MNYKQVVKREMKLFPFFLLSLIPAKETDTNNKHYSIRRRYMLYRKRIDQNKYKSIIPVTVTSIKDKTVDKYYINLN